MSYANQSFLSILLLLLLIGCSEPPIQEPLPELTYTGEEPKIQNPLSPEDSQKHIQLPDGFEAFLYAAEPDIINPIAMTWDERGRLWVVQSMDYPHGLDNDVGGDRITICEDTDGDGKADKFTDFATDQSLSTGITIVKGGALVAQAPEMAFLEDTDGDDKMDKRTVLFGGFGTYDTHAGPSNLRYGPDNMIWGSVGYSGFENDFDGVKVNFTRGVYKFARDGSSFEPLGQFNNNTWGLGISQDFEIFGSTANNNHACYVGIPMRHYDYLDKMPSWAISADFIQGHYEITAVDPIPLQQVDVRGGYTAAAGANFYTATNYPKEYHNQMYVNEPTGHLVHIAKIVEDGAGYQEVDGGNIFASTDSWTAPVCSETGPDGNLWVADWYNPVIQHNPDQRGMDNQIWNADKGKGNAHNNQHRDKGHGRIYIIKHKKDKQEKIKTLAVGDEKGLIAGLESDNMFWRTTAQRIIVENNITALIPSLEKLAKKSEKGMNGSANHALWSLQGLGVFGEDAGDASITIIDKGLKNKSHAVRKSAISLLPRSEKGSELLLESGVLSDRNMHVRLAAILKAGELPENAALMNTMAEISQDDANNNDKWLSAALRIYAKEQNTEELKPDEVDLIVNSAEEELSTWKYTTEKPSDDWFAADFNDSSWKEDQGGFGTMDKLKVIKTEWNTDEIWLRKEVNIDAVIDDPVLKVLHDDGYKVYVNGDLLFEEDGSRRDHKLVNIDPSKSKSFKKGSNTIAVYCKDTGGEQFIDVGIGNRSSFKADKTIVLNTVPSKMAYDKTVLRAMAGEKLEITLNNIDEMPHNLVLLQKGSLGDFGKLVDQFLQNPDAAKMEYVPNSRYVLGATNMVDPAEKGVIQIRVPDEPGIYPFVCTFPGHWRMMQGVLEVTARGTYISENPNALNIAVMGGGGSHNFREFFGVADGKIMSQGGKNSVRYTESSEELTSLIGASDVLFISNNKPYNEDTKKAIFSAVNGGMPMLIYHPSLWYNWKDWPEYNKELVGGGSESHEKLQEFEVIVKKPNHPIMKGVPANFRITDELYRFKKDPAAVYIEVLAIGKGLESGEEFPVVWVVKHKKARIVGNSLGHDNDAHSLEAYQTILSNSLDYVKQGVKRKVN